MENLLNARLHSLRFCGIYLRKGKLKVNMGKSGLLFTLVVILSATISPFLFERSFAQENPVIPPRHQWKQLPDPDILTCKEGLILLQKINGSPACVSSYSYLKLIDRGYGKFDSSQLMQRQEMMDHLMEEMVSDSQLMHHWHTMMKNDPDIMQKTLPRLVLQLEESPEMLKNIMGPITTNSELRDKMIGHMKNHNQMITSFQQHTGWMSSVHRPMMGSGIGQGMNSGMHENTECSWCPEVKPHKLHSHQGFQQPKIMEDMLHHFWVNERMRAQIHAYMLENPDHMGLMADQMMGPLLGIMMDDPEIRQQMIDLMLENQDFMNSVRHENKFSD